MIGHVCYCGTTGAGLFVGGKREQADQPGGTERTARRPVFYPKDDTPGCTSEAAQFRDLYADFQALGAEVLGVSTDSVASHEKFAAKLNLPFPLLADPEQTVVSVYGVYKEKNMYGRKYMGVERTTFLIDRAGQIVKVYPKVKVPGHAAAVLKDIQAL
jgi:peroxiredoxin Q/BCP